MSSSCSLTRHCVPLLSNSAVLIDEEGPFAGLKIYGSPMTPLYGGAFAAPSAANRVHHWPRIPKYVNLSITHDPPYGLLDHCPGQWENTGDPELMARIESCRSSGYTVLAIHGAIRTFEKNDVLFVNGALLGMHGAMERRPAVFRIKENATMGRQGPEVLRVGLELNDAVHFQNAPSDDREWLLPIVTRSELTRSIRVQLDPGAPVAA